MVQKFALQIHSKKWVKISQNSVNCKISFLFLISKKSTTIWLRKDLMGIQVYSFEQLFGQLICKWDGKAELFEVSWTRFFQEPFVIRGPKINTLINKETDANRRMRIRHAKFRDKALSSFIKILYSLQTQIARQNNGICTAKKLL